MQQRWHEWANDKIVRTNIEGFSLWLYIDLELEFINSWEQMEQEFLDRVYSTQYTVSMTKLTNTKQCKDEPVLDYINR